MRVHVNKIRLPVKGGAWLRRFDDVPGIEKSSLQNQNKEKK